MTILISAYITWCFLAVIFMNCIYPKDKDGEKEHWGIPQQYKRKKWIKRLLILGTTIFIIGLYVVNGEPLNLPF